MYLNAILRTLPAETAGACLTSYLRLPDNGGDQAEFEIRVKNALKNFESTFGDINDSALESTINEAAKSVPFGDQPSSLALFATSASTDDLHAHVLPDEVDDSHQSGEYFDLTPLVAVGTKRDFQVLSLNRSGCQLYSSDGDRLISHNLDLTPGAVAEELGEVDFDDDTGFHSNANSANRSSGGADAAPQTHALGTAKAEQTEADLERYLTWVGKQIEKLSRDADVPLILAGGDRIVGRFRQLNDWPLIAEDFVDQNTSELSVEELGEQAWDIVMLLPRPRRMDLLERLNARLGSGDELASVKPGKIAGSAEQGAVEALFVSNDIKDARGEAAAINLSRAMVQTAQNGGIVYPAATGEITGDAKEAALLRF